MTQLQQARFPTLLLITGSPVKRLFFEGAIDKLEGYSLLCVSSSIEALARLKGTHISFIVIDEHTPQIDLAETCLNIRKQQEYQYVPILIITSHLKKSFTQRLLKAGATDFLRQPLEENEFFHRMEMAKETQKTQSKMSALTSLFQEDLPVKHSMQERSILGSRAANIISSALEEKSSLAMLLVEIDQYEHLHTSIGSDAWGDLLIDFQNYLQKLMRRQDFLFPQRKGQFVLILPKTSPRASQFIAENIREALETETFSTAGVCLTLTISIGLATLEKGGLQDKSASSVFNRLMRETTTYLNEAKKKGNTIIFK